MIWVIPLLVACGQTPDDGFKNPQGPMGVVGPGADPGDGDTGDTGDTGDEQDGPTITKPTY